MRSAISAAAARLGAVSDTPELDASLLFEHAHDDAVFAALVERRLAHEPVAYITGTRGFWSIDLDVTPAVLIPRPDSETLIEAAVARFGPAGPACVLDLGTGSGALLLAALDEWPAATGVGVDASPAALAVAQANADRIAPGRVDLRLGDWGAGLGERFDLILCNPPYVARGEALMPDVVDHEPHAALFAGDEGLDDYRRLIPQFGRLLADGGMIALEIGHAQADTVSALAQAAGFSVALRRDLGGRDRCLVLERA